MDNTFNTSNILNPKHNLTIPIQITNSNSIHQKTTLGHYIEEKTPPILSLDLTDPIYEQELQLQSIVNEIESKNKQIREIEKMLQESEKTIKELTQKAKDKENNLNYYQSVHLENENTIKNLTQQKITLFQSIPNHNYNINNEPVQLSQKEYYEKKFISPPITDEYIIKTLDKDLKDYATYIKSLIKAKMPITEEIIKQIKTAIHIVLPDHTLDVYGSYATGLCLPWSDIDLVLTSSSEQQMQTNVIIYNLKRLATYIGTQKWVAHMNIVDNNSIPVIKITAIDDYGNMKIDISIQGEKHYGMKCVNLIKSYLKEYIVLEPLVFALKTILKNANLNNPYLGGLSSYGLILMIVSYIQSEIDNQSYDEANNEFIVGDTFYGFLQHFGIYFDYSKFVILTYPTSDFVEDGIDDETNLNFGQNHSDLIIVDPLNKQNNVAKNTSQYMNMKMAFMIAYKVAKEDCECGCRYGKAANDYLDDKGEHCILKRMFNSVKRLSD